MARLIAVSYTHLDVYKRQGMRVLPLSHEKHMEAHTLGRDTFLKKYHLSPVTLDDRLCRRYGLKG